MSCFACIISICLYMFCYNYERNKTSFIYIILGVQNFYSLLSPC